MIRSRINPHPVVNPELRELSGPALPSGWMRAAAQELAGASRKERAFLLLAGASDLVGFRLRVAQSLYRSDALPSLFSHALLVFSRGREAELVHVPLFGQGDPAFVPRRNGIEHAELSLLDARRDLYPNLALLSFPVDDAARVRASVDMLAGARLTYDFVSAIPPWIAFSWALATADNPLRAGLGLPSATFAEACYAACHVDVAPGITERVICPEVVWQGIKWWPGTFGGEAAGRFRLLQHAAAVTSE